MSPTENDPPAASQPAPRRSRRWRWAVGLAVVVAILAGLVASAPALLNTPAGRRLVGVRLDRAFAPGHLRFDSIRFSWTAPTRLTHARLDDAAGKTVVTAPTATLSPSLWGLLTAPERLGTLALDSATFDVSRRADGTIDLAESLSGIFARRDRQRDLTIRADRAALTVSDARLGPLVQGRMDLTVAIAPDPRPLTCSIAIDGEPGRSLRIDGELDQWRARPTSRETPDFTLSAVVAGWPLASRLGGIEVSATAGGRVVVSREDGRLHADGSAGLASIRAGELGRGGDPFPLDAIETAWSITGSGDDWSVERFSASSPLGRLSMRANHPATGHRLDVADLTIATRYATLQAAGRIGGLDGSASVDLSGTIAPDWTLIAAMLVDRVEPRATLKGSPGAFRVKGPLGGGGLQVEAALNVEAADLFGMRLGATPIVARFKGSSVVFDPIETTLNGGRLHLEPTLDLDEPGGPIVRLGPESSLTDAVVNEEVSRRVLSFVAPVLDRTTRASGRVSLTIDDAEFPLTRDVGRKANVAGSVVFKDVEFAPGPLAREVFAMVSSREPGILRLDEPVFLSIADGRVNQRGLAIPLGDVTRVELEGWVDFDKNLGLVASLPITPAMFPNRPRLGDLVSGTRIKVPISGTLASPTLDKAALNANLKELGTSLLTRTATAGALQLLNNMAKPRVRDPDAPLPPSLEERKAMRIEKKNQRRRARGLDPVPGPGVP